MRQIAYRLLSIVFFVGIFQLCTSSAFAFSGSGSGSSGDPFQITTCNQLQEMVNNLSAFYLQKNNIDCTSVSFIPIGTSSVYFTGTFDGGGYTIANLAITGSGDTALFGGASGATITNAHIISGSMTGTGSETASFIGWNQNASTISYSSSQATIVGGTYVGGLVGIVNLGMTIQKSYYNGSITLTNNNYLGGLVGIFNSGVSSLSDSYSSGTYTASVSGAVAGGVVGIINTGASVVNKVYSNATITMGSGFSVGGLVGQLQSGTVSNSFSAVTIPGSSTSHIGGAFGTGGSISTGNYFDATLAGTSSCSGTGADTCTAENVGNSNANYFKGNNTNAPLTGWDFTNTWQINSNGYPTLHVAGYMPPASSSSSSSGNPSAPSCGSSAPTNAPNLFQVSANGTSVTTYFVPVSGSNTGYYISYGVNSDASGFGTQFTYSNTSGVVPYTINSLFPGTWYFKVRGQNGCMPGNWSGVMSVKVSAVGSSSSTPIGSNKVLGAATQSTIASCSNYTVQSGDTLWGIASSHLGNGNQFNTILQKNNLPSTLLHVGQVLKVGC